MMLIESGEDLITVDCGLMFPDDELPGIDHVIPDFSYVLGRREGFRAVVLTHGHEDHIGALPYLLRELPVPVYGTRLTLALVAERLREHGLAEAADLRVIRPRDRIEAGSLGVEAIRVTHSIVDGIGLAIDTPVGTIVHTGDFKLDPSPLDGEPPDYRRFAALAELPANRQVILSTGSQGEPNSALALMASSEHKYVQVERGDLVIISARVIPGHERTIGRVVNALYRLGAEVLYEDNAFVHVSGHASQDDLQLMMSLTRPRYFVPVHGEYRHLLGHARLAALARRDPDAPFDRELVGAAVRSAVRHFVNQRFRRKPVVLPIVLEV